MTQTILTAKEFLEKHIADMPHLNKAGDFANSLWADDIAFQKAKTDKVVGRDILVRFLGGNWNNITLRITFTFFRGIWTVSISLCWPL